MTSRNLTKKKRKKIIAAHRVRRCDRSQYFNALKMDHFLDAFTTEVQ